MFLAKFSAKKNCQIVGDSIFIHFFTKADTPRAHPTLMGGVCASIFFNDDLSIATKH